MRKHFTKLAHWVRTHTRNHSDANPLSSVILSPVEESANYIETIGPPEVDGSVAYADGHFQITDPVGMGMYPSLVIPNRLRQYVSVDEQKVYRETIIVASSTKVSIEIPHIPPEVDVHFSVSEDRLSVSIAVVLKHGTAYAVRPFAPTIKAVLQTDKTIDPAKAPSFEELRERLLAKKYKGEIDDEALIELSNATSNMERVVLRGKRAVPGSPPVLKPAALPEGFDPLHRNKPLKTVKAGTIVGYVEDGTPPTSGIDVYGDVISLPDPVAHLPTLGYGVTRVHYHIIATQSGRVSFSPTLVDVIPQLILHQDITPKEGYIVFDGDMVIFGTVQDGSRVKATGSITILGGVLGSTIIGQQGVVIKGSCVKSNILVGWAQELYKDVLPLVQSLIGTLDVFEQDFTRILKHIDTAGMSNDKRSLIGGVLIEEYHTELVSMLSKLVNQYKSDSLHQVAAHLEPIVQTIQSHWLGIQYKHLTMQNVEELTDTLRKYRTYIESTISEDTADATVESITSSTIHCTGNVTVTGFGSYSSVIESGRKIEVKGLVRGGFLTAQHAIFVQEFGAETGTETSAQVIDHSGMIDIALRHPNTVLVIDGKRDRNLFTEKYIRLGGAVNHDSEIVARG